MKKINIIIADDHPIFLKGLRQILEARVDFKIVGEANDGSSALELIETKRPDVAIIDINMPVMDGLEVAGSVQKKKLPVHIIILTMYDQEDIFRRALDLGVMGYVLKAAAAANIPGCVEAVAAGRRFISPELSECMLIASERFNEGLHQKFGLTNLSPTQKKVLCLIARNQTTVEIAEELSISPKTVENHRAHICEKLNLHGPNALLRFVIEHKHLF